MSGILSDAAGLLMRALHWWGGELASLWPTGTSASAAHNQADATIAVGADGALRLVEAARRGRDVAAASGLDGENITFDYLSRLQRSRPDAKIRLRLPFSACFERRVDIPAAARSQAASILALDLERSTPFKASDVYISHTLVPAPGRKGWLTGTQFVAKRKLADKAIAEIQSLGLKVESMDCWAADGKTPLPLNFLEKTNENAVPRRSHRTHIGLAALACTLAISGIWLVMSRREAALANLEQQVQAARHSAEGTQQQRAVSDAVVKAHAAVLALKHARPSSVEIVNELTRLLPDEANLNDLKIDGDTVDIAGLAKSAAAIIPDLERASMFKDALQTSPVALDAAADKERFSLRLKLRQAAKTATAAPVGNQKP